MASISKVQVIATTSTFETLSKDGVISFKILSETSGPNTISLLTVVRSFVPGLVGKSVSADQVYLNLGKFRAARHVISKYNIAVDAVIKSTEEDKENPNPAPLDGVSRLARQHAIELFSVFAFQITSATDKVTVEGLDDFIAAIEAQFEDSISSHRFQIAAGMVPFDGLGELFAPGIIVSGATSLGSGVVTTGFMVRSGVYEEKKTLFGKDKCFKLELEYIVSFGKYFSTVRFEEVFSGWISSRVRPVSELPYIPIDKAGEAKFIERGEKCVSMVLGDGVLKGQARFVQYQNGSFYPHWSKRSQGMVPSASTGRIVIDSERGLSLGHYPSQGSDEATAAMLNTASRYKRILNSLHADSSTAGTKKSSTAAIDASGMVLFSDIKEPRLQALLWPALVGFSFTTKSWGHVLVDSLSEIAFNDNAFDLLVLSPQRKRLIKALVSSTKQNHFEDIVSGKAGGSVFLLHGPPGVGKTLTAEAIAELLHRPLYYVTMGELGTTAEEMENRLGSVLDLCAGWNALTIIDEADVFLEKRSSGSSGDIIRNAMVCVMLRLIEYHPGILFLTTNRVMSFDPAFESRVTVALRYDDLTPDAREQVWRNLIRNLKDVVVSDDLNYAKLAREHVLNGRQIKNAVRLALALAEDMGTGLSQSLIEETVGITSIGRQEMATAKEY
ncbi:hypothetical protein HDU76_004724 [Blyttiomyces sp. JEL0837]|nr:hypothetical protein HDU76_004724 [Blyttiomyces sp. JEL0837]